MSFGQQLFVFGACFGAIPNVDDEEGGAAVEREKRGAYLEVGRCAYLITPTQIRCLGKCHGGVKKTQVR